MPNHCVIRKSMLGHWYLAKACNEAYAWSGMKWMPHAGGIPASGGQLCSFATVKEATPYAKERELKLVLEQA